jgi:hypothetical protein
MPAVGDLVRCLAEPLFEHLERAGVGLVAVGGAGVGDDDRAVSLIACTTRVGFDGDVGGHPDEHEGVDACQADNGGAVEPVGRLSPDDRFVGSGARAKVRNYRLGKKRRCSFLAEQC